MDPHTRHAEMHSALSAAGHHPVSHDVEKRGSIHVHHFTLPSAAAARRARLHLIDKGLAGAKHSKAHGNVVAVHHELTNPAHESVNEGTHSDIKQAHADLAREVAKHGFAPAKHDANHHFKTVTHEDGSTSSIGVRAGRSHDGSIGFRVHGTTTFHTKLSGENTVSTAHVTDNLHHAVAAAAMMAKHKDLRHPEAAAALSHLKQKHESVNEDIDSGDCDTGIVDDTHMVIAGSPGFAMKSLRLKPNMPADLDAVAKEPYTAKRTMHLRKVGGGSVGGRAHNVYTSGAGVHLAFPADLVKPVRKESIDESLSPERRFAIDSQTMVLRMVDGERQRIIAVAKGLIPNEPRTIAHALAEYYHAGTPSDSTAGFDNWLAARYPTLYTLATEDPEGAEFTPPAEQPVHESLLTTDLLRKMGGSAIERVKLKDGQMHVRKAGKWHPVASALEVPEHRKSSAARRTHDFIRKMR